jgi:hypothetical protein
VWREKEERRGDTRHITEALSEIQFLQLPLNTTIGREYKPFPMEPFAAVNVLCWPRNEISRDPMSDMK